MTKLSDLLLTIQEIQGEYPFSAEDTFIDIERDGLTRKSKVTLFTITDAGFEVTIKRIVGGRK